MQSTANRLDAVIVAHFLIAAIQFWKSTSRRASAGTGPTARAIASVKSDEVREVLERGKLTLVLKGIPARVCSTCGEAYIDEATMKKIEAKVEQLERTGTQIAVQDYAA